MTKVHSNLCIPSQVLYEVDKAYDGNKRDSAVQL